LNTLRRTPARPSSSGPYGAVRATHLGSFALGGQPRLPPPSHSRARAPARIPPPRPSVERCSPSGELVGTVATAAASERHSQADHLNRRPPTHQRPYHVPHPATPRQNMGLHHWWFLTSAFVTRRNTCYSEARTRQPVLMSDASLMAAVLASRPCSEWILEPCCKPRWICNRQRLESKTCWSAFA